MEETKEFIPHLTKERGDHKKFRESSFEMNFVPHTQFSLRQEYKNRSAKQTASSKIVAFILKFHFGFLFCTFLRS